MASSPPDRRERDVAAVAALIAEPARAAILDALVGGVCLPAGELARRAAVHPATASTHLRRLREGGLVVVVAQGRHRYYRLAGAHVAAVLEELARIAPPKPVRSLRQHDAAALLAEARSCYDHLAGRRGVELRDRLLAADALEPLDERDHRLTAHGAALLARLEIDADRLARGRRVLARTCLDSTQRRPHLAGALAAVLTTRLIELGWLSPGHGRGLRPAPDYDQRLERWLSRA